MAEKQSNKRNDLTGKQFGRLTVVAFEPRNGIMFWKCQCACGNVSVVYGSNLTSGKSTSCGCRRSEVCKTKSITHGLTESSEYRTWRAAKERCFNPNNAKYPNYGGRGITMCDAWKNSFAAFIAYMGRRPSREMQLDRIDNDGNYEPGNCHWTTRAQNMRNRQDAIKATHGGVTLSLKEWAERTGMTYETLRYRFQRGQPLFTPVGPTSKRH